MGSAAGGQDLKVLTPQQYRYRSENLFLIYGRHFA